MAESKLAEKTVEIDKIMEENRAMKESMDRINNHQILKPEASKFFFSKISKKYLAKLFNNQFQNYESEFSWIFGPIIRNLTSLDCTFVTILFFQKESDR